MANTSITRKNKQTKCLISGENLKRYEDLTPEKWSYDSNPEYYYWMLPGTMWSSPGSCKCETRGLDLGDEAPYNYVYEPPEGVPKCNTGDDSHPVTINDIRGKEDTVSLDKTGFQFIKHVSEEKDFLDEELIKTRYYKEVEELLKNVTGAKRVLIFDHTIR